MSENKLKDKLKGSKIAEFIREKVKPVAGDILQVVGDITGRESIEKIGEYLTSNRDTDERIRALSAEFEMKRLEYEMDIEKIAMQNEIDTLRLENEDRKRASDREIEYMKITGKRDWLMGAVVVTGLLLTIGVVASLIFITIPAENQRLADMSFGSILSIGASIFAYYVGSSKSSRMKDETIKKALK